MNFSKSHLPYWLVAFSVMIALTMPVLIKDGMFMDAVQYAAVAHNMSKGIGTFWFPHLSKLNVGELPSFHEQPPLAFGIQSVFFRIFGDSLYVERFYTFLTMTINAALIVMIWKEIFKNNHDLKKIAWLPLIMWITIPVCFWSYSNDMNENTMGIFITASVLLMLQGFGTDKYSLIYLTLSGICIFLATLSKGIPGFFPIVLPVLYWLLLKNERFSKIILHTAILIIIPLVIYAILFSMPVSRESLLLYLFKRALHRINDVPTVSNRFYIFYRLFSELLPQLILISYVNLYYYRY